MTGVPAATWNGKFVAVIRNRCPSVAAWCNPESAPARGDGRIIAPRRAAESAVAASKQYGLDERKGWDVLSSKAEAAPGILVERLDRPEKSYHFLGAVPVEAADPRLRLDRRPLHATILQVAAAQGRRPFITRDERFKLVVDRRIQLGDLRGRLFREGAICMYPHLVWRRCRRSAPDHPFAACSPSGRFVLRSHRRGGLHLADARHERHLMPIGSPSDAARTARRLLGLSEGDEGSANRVRRLDRPVASYIVHTGGYVVALDEATVLRPRRDTALARDALLCNRPRPRRIGRRGDGEARLDASPPQRNPMFDPLGGELSLQQHAYIDQRGRLEILRR